MRTATVPLHWAVRMASVLWKTAEACGNRTQLGLSRRDTLCNNILAPRRIVSDKTTFAPGCTANRYRTATVRAP